MYILIYLSLFKTNKVNLTSNENNDFDSFAQLIFTVSGVHVKWKLTKKKIGKSIEQTVKFSVCARTLLKLLQKFVDSC